MAALVRPSLILQVDLDERTCSDEVIAGIKRSYSYVAPTTVATHEPGEGPARNVMRFRIRLHRPYWDKNDPDAEKLWSGMMPTWLRNMFYKVSSTIVAAAKMSRKQGDPVLEYAWVELEFGDNALVAVKTADDSSIPEEAVGWVERVRDLMGEGAFGDEPLACVRIPSLASLERQRALALAELEAAAAVKTDVVAGDDVASGDVAADGDVEIVEAAEAVEAAEVPPIEEPKFAIDYTVWGIEAADGGVREFDSGAAAFLS